jgi:CRP-like cAMP-binding protein
MGEDGSIRVESAACRPAGPGSPPFPGAREAGAEYRRYAAREAVFVQGAPVPAALLVVEGGVKLVRQGGAGRGQLLDILPPGTWAGAAPVLAQAPADAGGEAHGELEGWLVPAGAFRAQILRDPDLRDGLLRQLAEHTRHLVRLAGALSLHTVPERVAQLILDAPGRTARGSLVEFGRTQEDLARGLGASREAFSRALPLLAELGLVQATFPVVRILDRPRLERFAQGSGHAPWPRGGAVPETGGSLPLDGRLRA